MADHGRRFDGKSVIVTGGASGIGRATALRLAEEGGRVLAVDLDAAGLPTLYRKLIAKKREIEG